MRLVGERKALAAAVMAFWAIMFFLNGVAGPPDFKLMFVALATTYGIGFFGLVAGWFWARWYAMGLGFSGVIIAAILGFQIGLDPIVLIFGLPHGVAVLSLVGRGPAAAYDGRPEWREKWRMDDNAANRLGKAVTRAGASLPYLVMAGLAPRQGMGETLLALGALALGAAGLSALVRMRTWGVIALAGAAVLAAATPAVIGVASWGAQSSPGGEASRFLVAPSILAAMLLILASASFAKPLLRALRA